MRLRTGDRAIVIGCAAICAYEKWVADDEDLISRRVSHYRKTPIGRLLTDALVLATAIHLCEIASPEWDVYHYAMTRLRRHVTHTT